MGRLATRTPPPRAGPMKPPVLPRVACLPRISPAEPQVTPSQSPPRARSARPTRSKSPPSPSTSVSPRLSPIIRNAPITPAVALATYSALLTAHEKTEILDYPEIYYIGVPAAKISNTSAGFDMASHHYKANIHDHIAYRYEIRSTFGRGAFGQVLKCYDHKLRQTVALKIVINTRQMRTQSRAEMEFVALLNAADPTGSSHIVKLYDMFEFRGHTCATFEALGRNLYEHSKQNNYRAMPLPAVRRVSRELLEALAFTHAHGVVHCDIKPENVLLCPPPAVLSISLVDFGSACRSGDRHFGYIQSRFYRAPEVILGMPYGPPIDMWSFACVVAEMTAGRPVFAGDSEATQIHLHMDMLGPPPPRMVAAAPRRPLFFHSAGTPRVPLGPARRPLARASRIEDPRLLDLLARCLQWDPAARVSAADALRHPFFADQAGGSVALQMPITASENTHCAQRSSAPSVSQPPARARPLPPKDTRSADAHLQARKPRNAVGRGLSPKRAAPGRY